MILSALSGTVSQVSGPLPTLVIRCQIPAASHESADGSAIRRHRPPERPDPVNCAPSDKVSAVFCLLAHTWGRDRDRPFQKLGDRYCPPRLLSRNVPMRSNGPGRRTLPAGPVTGGSDPAFHLGRIPVSRASYSRPPGGARPCCLRADKFRSGFCLRGDKFEEHSRERAPYPLSTNDRTT